MAAVEPFVLSAPNPSLANSSGASASGAARVTKKSPALEIADSSLEHPTVLMIQKDEILHLLPTTC